MDVSQLLEEIASGETWYTRFVGKHLMNIEEPAEEIIPPYEDRPVTFCSQ
jgi:hypothetical protein